MRVLVGLIHREGLVSFNSEAELARNALAAYRAYRRKAFSTYIPWVLVGRMVRDLAVSIWNTITGGRSYAEVEKETAGLKRDSIKVHFVGVWDTVVAYGLPIDELTRAVDKWVWPMKFRDDSLLFSVRHARQARSESSTTNAERSIRFHGTKARRGISSTNGVSGLAGCGRSGSLALTPMSVAAIRTTRSLVSAALLDDRRSGQRGIALRAFGSRGVCRNCRADGTHL